MNNIYDNKTKHLANIIRKNFQSIKNILVVGCGDGVEAAILAEEFNAKVVGIDVQDLFRRELLLNKNLTLMIGDARALTFNNNSFDLVYSYHALEHIIEYRKALLEIKRVLMPGGGYLIGTPNKSRLLGYIGSKKATFFQKIKWNLNDLKYKVIKKFENKYGAHAGFTSKELSGILIDTFGSTEEITWDYYFSIYRKKRHYFLLIMRFGLKNLGLPSIYFLGKNLKNF